MINIKNYKTIITKYFYRIFLFFVFYHGLIRPLQTSINHNIVKPFVLKKIANDNNYIVKVNQHHLKVILKSDNIDILHISIPFGQAYFFLIFFIWFKPYKLIVAMSFYNFTIIPAYALAIELLFNGHPFIGNIIILHEKFFRYIYGLIFLIKILRPNQFNLIFDNK